MKIEDAPAAGWYPDPTGGSRLWWWDGVDWTDHRRAPQNPGAAFIEEAEARAAARLSASQDPIPPLPQPGPTSRSDTQDLIAEVRQVARSEVGRAAELFTQRSQDAARQLQPLVSQYSSDLLRWVRILVIAAFVLLVGWIVLQTVAETNTLDWLGDRVDNVTRPE